MGSVSGRSHVFTDTSLSSGHVGCCSLLQNNNPLLVSLNQLCFKVFIDFSPSPKTFKVYLCFNDDQVGLGWLLTVFVFICLRAISFYASSYAFPVSGYQSSCFCLLFHSNRYHIIDFSPLLLLTTSLNLSNWLFHTNTHSFTNNLKCSLIYNTVPETPNFLISAAKEVLCQYRSMVWGKGNLFLFLPGAHLN